MKRYKVIAGNCFSGRKKHFGPGEEVTEKDFPAGVADKRVEDGFLKFLGNDGASVEEEEDEVDIAAARIDTSEVDKESDEYKGITRNDLLHKLDQANVEYDSDISKAEAFALWKKVS